MLSLELPSTHMDKQETCAYWGLTSSFQHRKDMLAKAESKGKPTFHPHLAQDGEFLKQVSTTACQGWGLGWVRRGQQNSCASVSPLNPEKQTKWHTEVHPHPPFLLGFFLFSCFTPWVITPATLPARKVQTAKMVTEMETSPLPIPFQGLRRKGTPSTAILQVSPWPELETELRVEGKTPTPGAGEGPWQERSPFLTVLGKDNEHRAALPSQTTNKPVQTWDWRG